MWRDDIYDIDIMTEHDGDSLGRGVWLDWFDNVYKLT